ncbi:MAG: restriction endonuclease subunit S, partial [Pseudanabaena sp.]
LIEEGDLLFARQSLVLSGAGKCSIVKEVDEPTTFESHLIRIRLKRELANPYFYHYYFKSPKCPIHSIVTQGVQAGIRGNDLKQLKVHLPPIEIQNRIADIISNYDDLIENNRRRIQLLERSLHLLYKEWFVHLRFPSHEHSKIVDGIPEGWEKKPLGSFVTLNYGKSLQSDKRVSGNYPVYGSSGIIGTHTEPLVKGHGIIVGRKGNVGKVFWADSDYFPIDTVYFISPESSNFFLFYTLLNTQFTSTDVAVPGLNRNFAHSVNILIPDKKLLEIFEDLAKPIRKQISTLNKQNESLGKARDLLLPKLMSGAISV